MSVLAEAEREVHKIRKRTELKQLVIFLGLLSLLSLTSSFFFFAEAAQYGEIRAEETAHELRATSVLYGYDASSANSPSPENLNARARCYITVEGFSEPFEKPSSLCATSPGDTVTIYTSTTGSSRLGAPETAQLALALNTFSVLGLGLFMVSVIPMALIGWKLRRSHGKG